MLSQGDISGEENLVDYFRGYFGRNYVGLIHRLDRNTSGIMIVGKRTKAANRLTESLRKGELKRSYLAIVEGEVAEQGTLEDYLHKDEKTNESRVVDSTHKEAKRARLSFERVATTAFKGKKVSLVHITLDTGRSHQIRVQFSHAGHPLLGDSKYRSKITQPGRPALHSYSLEVPHPMDEDTLLSYKDPLPLDLAALLPSGTPLP